MAPGIGDQQQSLPSGPWGTGGFEVPVYHDELNDLRNFIRSNVPCLSAPNCEAMARYICAMEHAREAGGPSKVSDVDNALSEGEGNAYGLISRNQWNWRLVRHQGTSTRLTGQNAAPPRGIVVSATFTDYDDPGSLIVTAHAFSDKWRMLVAVARTQVDAQGEIPGREEVFRAVVDEVAALRAKLPSPIPVLVESPVVGRRAIPHLAASNLDYLVELTLGWSEGGLIPASTGEPHLLSAAGVSIRGLFPQQPVAPGKTESRPVRLTAWSQDLRSVALLAGPPEKRRAYLADARNSSQHKHHQAISRPRLEGWADYWSKHYLCGALDNYSFEHFRAKPDEHFQKHFTTVAVRDAYTVFKAAG